ncbi:MAG TPA: rhomboid family intramembrane serine protease [Clostridiales bacterium]|nr:rhomboid family intramembrane serine protease [Clostridiales bacterium]
MKIEDRILNAFKSDDYLELETGENAPNILYKKLEDKTLLIILWSGYNFNEVTIIQYGQYIEWVKKHFAELQYSYIDVLSIVITDSVDNIRKFSLETDTHWGVFVHSEKLIIFENQSYDFYGLREIIEIYLMEDKPEPKKDRPYISLVLILINVIVFLSVPTVKAYTLGATSWAKVVVDKEYHRIISSMFLHADFRHLMNNMFILYVLGENLENLLNRGKYVILYLSSGIVASMISILYYHTRGQNVISIGASGAVYGLMGAFIANIFLEKNKKNKKVKKRTIIIVALLVISFLGEEILSNSVFSLISKSNIDHAAHIAGGITGIIIMLILKYMELRNNIRDGSV